MPDSSLRTFLKDRKTLASFIGSELSNFKISLVFQAIILMPVTGFRIPHTALVFAVFFSPILIGYQLEKFAKRFSQNLAPETIYIVSAFFTMVLMLLQFASISIIQSFYSTTILKRYLTPVDQETTLLVTLTIASTYLYITVYVPTIQLLNNKPPFNNIKSIKIGTIKKWRKELYNFLLSLPLSISIINSALAEILKYDPTLQKIPWLTITLAIQIISTTIILKFYKKSLTISEDY